MTLTTPNNQIDNNRPGREVGSVIELQFVVNVARLDAFPPILNYLFYPVLFWVEFFVVVFLIGNHCCNLATLFIKDLDLRTGLLPPQVEFIPIIYFKLLISCKRSFYIKGGGNPVWI